ncbi:MAG: hypothetical protein ACYDG2_20930 [Ruminiclostridium sp.]
MCHNIFINNSTLPVEKDVPAELVRQSFDKVKVYEIIRANEDVKKVLLSLK